jgi:hypothetical protein
MLTAILFNLFINSAYAHNPVHVHKHVNHKHQQQTKAHVNRGVVWVNGRGWTPRYLVRWIPGHYTGVRNHRHWVSGRFVIKRQ